MADAGAKDEAHVLQHKWSFYLHYPTFGLDTRKYSSQAYDHLADAATVESFWRLFAHIPKPSDAFSEWQGSKVVRPKVNGRHLEALGLFKAGVKPEWEFPLNLKGGHWECRKDFPLPVLDRIWYDLSLALVGETLEAGREIVGCRVVDKSKAKYTEYRVEIWVGTAHTSAALEIVTKATELLHDIDPDVHFEWKAHGDSLTTALWCNAETLGLDKETVAR
jgi:hypothetical protein